MDGEEGSASVRGRGTGFVGGSRRGGNFSTYSAQRPAAARFQPVPAGYARTGSLSPVANSTDGKPAGSVGMRTSRPGVGYHAASLPPV